jgi:hypothetical protein
MGKATGLFGPKNPNWKGGKSKTSHGYMLVRQPDHPRAFSNGYVYEHIVVAERLLGRPLLPEEEVHHDDGDGLNNAPENLVVKGSHLEHFFAHRKPGSKYVRAPGEPNVEIECACGCGERLLKYDGSGRLRRYLPSHNLRVRGSIGRAIAKPSP